MRLVLIGPRGCGKSSIGRLLGERLGCAFVDLDDRTAARFEQRSIAQIWQEHGEAAWREAEVRALRDVLQESSGDQVIALGGGTPAIPEARHMLLAERPRGLRVVYLKCPIDELARRLRNEPGDRPSITGRDPVEEIAHVLAQREPTYEAIADVVVDAASSPERVAAAILHVH